MLDEPHYPARHYGAPDEQDKAERAKPDHHPRLSPLCDAEHNRGKKGKQQNRPKVRNRHERFLPVANE